MVDLDLAIQAHQREIGVADREHQVPPHGSQHLLRSECRPLEAPAPTHCGPAPRSTQEHYTPAEADLEIRNRAYVTAAEPPVVAASCHRQDLAFGAQACGFVHREQAVARHA